MIVTQTIRPKATLGKVVSKVLAGEKKITRAQLEDLIMETSHYCDEAYNEKVNALLLDLGNGKEVSTGRMAFLLVQARIFFQEPVLSTKSIVAPTGKGKVVELV